ncbi:MAG: MFS transporter [Actinobacteria bacterium]|nr:MFS transporter [Actinomycetota bacterium]
MTGPAPVPPKVGIREILENGALRTIMGVVFVTMLGFGIVLPILPLFAKSFQVSDTAAGLLISSFALTRLLFDLVAGPLVDRYGERWAGAAGVFFVAASSVATALAPTFTLAVVFRGIGGAGSSVLFGALFSYLLKVVPKERMARSLSVFFATFNVAVIAGGPLGGVIAHAAGLRAPLYVYSALLVVSGVLFLRFVKDPGRGVNAEEPALTREEAMAERDMPVLRRTRVRVGRLLSIPGFTTACVLNFAYLWMVSGPLDTLIPLFGTERLGMTELGIGTVFAVALLAEFVVLFPAGAAADRHGRRAVVIPSFLALAVMTVVTGFATTPWMFAAFLALFGLASGYAGVPPGAMLSDVSPEEGRGTSVGVFRFAGDLGMVLSPYTMGLSANLLGYRAAFAIGAIPIVVALLVVLRTPETLKRPDVGAT